MIEPTGFIAFSAAVQAGATIVLVAVTAKYVRLTKNLVETNREQLQDARALVTTRTEVDRSHLRVLTEKVISILEPLPSQGMPESQLRYGAMWSETDEKEFVELSASLGPDVGELASRAAPALSWLRQLHGRIIRVDERMGYGVNQREAEQYQKNRATALANVKAIALKLR